MLYLYTYKLQHERQREPLFTHLLLSHAAGNAKIMSLTFNLSSFYCLSQICYPKSILYIIFILPYNIGKDVG